MPFKNPAVGVIASPPATIESAIAIIGLFHFVTFAHSARAASAFTTRGYRRVWH
jgi:hypothetical protein